MKKFWCQQNSRSVSRDLYIFWIFFRQDITGRIFIIVGYAGQILEGGAFLPPPPPDPSVSSPEKAQSK